MSWIVQIILVEKHHNEFISTILQPLLLGSSLSALLPPLQCLLGQALPTPLCTFPRIQNLRPQRDTSPINHLCCTPVILGSQTQNQGRTQQTCSQGRFRLLPPAPHSRLNCRALHYSHIIHASLIKSVNSRTVKLENVQHLLSGNLVPGTYGGECQVCVWDLPKGALIGFSIIVSGIYT